MRTRLLFVVLAVLAICGLSAGCSSQNNSGLNPTQQQQADRLHEIAQKSGGDWNKVSPDDKAYLIKMNYGDAKGAPMMLLAISGKMGYHGGAKPSGPPKPGGGTSPGQPTGGQ